MQAVLSYLRANERRFIAELSAYVRFPSVSAQPQHRDDLQRCAEWLTEHCRMLGLDATLHATPGNPILLARTPRKKGSRKKHFVVYGHYDVQPPEPFELWKSPPFEPRIEGRNMFARGASDNKGQNFAHLKAAEAFLKTSTELPVDLTFVIEGEEEVGCENLAPFLRKHRERLKCDGVVISDNGIPSPRHPALTYALRGILAMELRLDGPDRDLHSGIFGGSVENPAMALCQLIARLRDANGRITVPGYYDDVKPLTAYERKQLASVPHSDASYQKFLGAPALSGEQGFSSVERRTSRPTCEINGLTSGYQGAGSKTIVPAWARAKLTFRLVPDQDPARAAKLIVAHLKKLCPPSVRLTVEVGHAGEPYIVSPTGAQAQAALRALKAGWGYEPVLAREGGSIPIVNDFRKILGVDTLLLGMALKDDNPHSPNEKFDLDCFAKGMATAAHLWRELAAA
ncbi:MAG: dipeptidase [Verrucomicrobia bacterium]|nr:dipeptidase [Verrucomicrobiota bacterium]